MRIVFACSLVLVVACGKDHGNNSGDDTSGDPDAAMSIPCVKDEQCPMGQKCDLMSGVCVGGCGYSTLDLSYVPPNLMFVLDRSCSMDEAITGTMTTKWQATVAALDHVLMQHATDIRWGATLFPDTTGMNCTQDALPYPIADAQAPAIQTMLQNSLTATDPLFPDGPCVTNIDTGVLQAATDTALDDTARKSYLMLVTDGAQSGCNAGGGNNGTEMAVKDLHDTRGVTTFVVGFGSGVNRNELNMLADLGGAPLAGTDHFYRADTAADIDVAFAAIANFVVSCDYHVDQAPPDLDQTYVYFNMTELLGRDPTHMMGWDYDPTTMTLTFYGADCDRLKNRTVTDVDVVFGCPVPPIQ